MRIGATKKTAKTATTGAVKSQPAMPSRTRGRWCHGSRSAAVAPVASMGDPSPASALEVLDDLLGGLLQAGGDVLGGRRALGEGLQLGVEVGLRRGEPGE